MHQLSQPALPHANQIAQIADAFQLDKADDLRVSLLPPDAVSIAFFLFDQ